MTRRRELSRRRLARLVLGVGAAMGLMMGGAAAEAALSVVVLFPDHSEESGAQSAENAMTRVFRERGYKVVDRGSLEQILRRDTALLGLYEIETAKQLGSRLQADIVVKATSRVTTREKTYSSLGGKKVLLSQADVSAKLIWARDGRVLAAESESARKPFDMSGETAADAAGSALATRLAASIDEYVNRPTLDYRLVLAGVDHAQGEAFRGKISGSLPGVESVGEAEYLSGRVTVDVSVAKEQDAAFKQALFGEAAAKALGSVEIVARDGTNVFFRKSSPAKKSASAPRPAASTPAARRNESAGRERAGEAAPSPTRDPERRYKPGYRRSWAVVVGINSYENWPPLEYAVPDAEAVAKSLRTRGFDEVITLLDGDATRENILRILGDELAMKTDENDQVVIFFAGHGQTQDLQDGSKEGYIIPVDGDLTNYYSTAISMHQLQDLSARIRAKHIFYMMDSCFSGLLVRLRGINIATKATVELLDEMPDAPPQTTLRARQVLTAGAEGEVVIETGGHGLFTQKVLAGLAGEGDLNGDGFVMASELYRYVSRQVIRESGNRQNPTFGRLDSDPGDFVFLP